MMDVDYLQFYDVEAYLLDKVGERFHENGVLNAVDFYMILIWKANRAKTYHRKRLTKIGGTFREAVSRIASSLYSCAESRDRLKVLMDDWGFALPTATAILAILYPKEFTVYDQLVCREIGHKYRPYLSFSDSLWDEYKAFHKKVLENTPEELCLRDKDRFLIGRSFRRDVVREVEAE